MNAAGHVEIVAAKEIQEKLFVIHSGKLNEGDHRVDVDISVLPHEFHYLLLFYEGKLAHFLELDLR